MNVWWMVLASVLGFIGLVALFDILQTKHAVKHNYPVIGRFRYWLEMIGPELRQYWVADDKEEQPFNRSERSWIYATAKGQNNYQGFGSNEVQYAIGYPIIKNAVLPFPEDKAVYPGDDPTAIPCIKIMGQFHGRRRPYRPTSIVNISGMSFGALGRNAISALNKGAKMANCYHNTGEGAVSPYHQFGADVVWQIGTGYFGARDKNGKFSLDVVEEKIADIPNIRAIEIKLSQGAKPGRGGVLPEVKVVPEIARTRHVPMGQDCLSPNAHVEFDSPDGLIDFVESIADRTGLPVGIKAAIGETNFWYELAERMRARKEGPDYFQIDGGEGGTGAAPMTYADHVALPFKIAFNRVYCIFQQVGISQDLLWIGSGKLGFPDRTVVALAMGCDLVAIAREAMMSIGCIQAMACHTGHCPTGVTTMSKWRQAGLDVDRKSLRCATFIRGFRKELLSLAHTAGYQHPVQFTVDDIELSVGVNKFATLREVVGYCADPAGFTSMKKLTPV